MLRLLYFAWVREAIGRGEEVIDPRDCLTVADLLDRLAQDEPYATTFADRGRLRAALDQGFVTLDAPLAGARELAIFPPVTGG